jgi:histone deacetylase 1/2
LVEVVSARTTPIPLRDLYAQLLSTEQRITRRKAALHGGHNDFSANAAHRGGGSGAKPAYRPEYRMGPHPRSLPRPFYLTKTAGQGPNSGGNTRPGQGDRGGGDRDNQNGGDRDRGVRNGGGGGGNRPICQICDKPGHKASSCFKRFKQDYLGVDNDGRYMERQVAAATTPGQTSSYSVDSGWYMDTGATDHLTNHLDKLTVKENYTGNDQVHAANGHGMHIHHIGQTTIPTSSSHSLRLEGILHVPSVTRSLLSVRRFTLDNKVYIEFHPHFFLVKDRDTKTILLSGRCHGGLYRLDESSLKQVFS